jgi:hypothetical protein
MCVAYLRFAVDLPGHYRVLFHARRTAPTGGPASDPSQLAELGWPPNAAESFEDLVRGMKRCLPAGESPFRTATMVWTSLHGYASLSQTLVDFPFPTPEQFVARLLATQLNPEAPLADSPQLG